LGFPPAAAFHLNGSRQFAALVRLRCAPLPNGTPKRLHQASQYPFAHPALTFEHPIQGLNV